MVLLTLLIPLAWWVMPGVQRWLIVRDLTAESVEDREAALQALVKRGRVDPVLVEQAVGVLEDLPAGGRFNAIARALDLAGAWHREAVGPGVWLRWLEPLGTSDDPRARLELAAQIVDLPELADDPAMHALLAKLIDDQDAAVRYAALVTAAELHGHAVGKGALVSVIRRAEADANPTIARHAMILGGLLGAGDVSRVPNTPGVGGVSLDGGRITLSPTAVREALALDPAALSPEDVTRVWRAILAAPEDDDWRGVLRRWADPDAAWAQQYPHLVAAAMYRLGEPMPLSQTSGGASATQRRWQLAAMEGAGAKGREWGGDESLPADTPLALRLALASIKEKLTADDLLPLLTAQSPTLRDRAAVLAATRLSKADAMALADDLLRSFDDTAVVAGAMVAALADVRPTTVTPVNPSAPPQDLLAYRAKHEDDPVMREALELALWMRGDLAELRPPAEVLFRQHVLDGSTVLLAMLHRGGADRRLALDLLFNPRGEPTLDLDHLLVAGRWWEVLRRYLPEDAPQLWLWADPELRALQIDVLRDWWLVERGK